MKKIFAFMGMAVAATMALTGCQKDALQNSEEFTTTGSVPFELLVNPGTKTANDGMSTIWAADDSITVFHEDVTALGTYVPTNDSGDAFSISSENLASNKFTGALATPLESGHTYNWYALYPYNYRIKTPANTGSGYLTIGSEASAAQTQTGNDNMSHIAGQNYPFIGKATGVADDETPVFSMTHVSSLVEVKVTNKLAEPLTISRVTLTSQTDSLVGTFYINFAGETPAFKPSGTSYASKTATLNVESGAAIAAEGSAKFYLAVKPFTATSGQTLTVRVSGSTASGSSVHEKAIALVADAVFQPGKIKKINVDYNTAVSSDYVTLPWDYAGGTSSDLNAVAGVTTSGLGSDYAEARAPYRVKFDTSGDYIQVKTDAAIGTVSIGYAMLGGGNTSYLNIFESVDGSDWGERIDRLTISGAQYDDGNVTTTASFNAASRFVKIVFEKGSNVGIGPISIHAPSLDPAISAANISSVLAIGVTDATSSYTANNFADDVEVANEGGFTGCVTAASATSGVITYSVAPNYTTSAAEGTIKLWSAADHSVTKTVNVSQLSSSLTASTETVTIPADETSATFTVTTPEFSYDASVASVEAGKNLTISSGDSGTANASAQTITVASTTDAPTEGDAITLGTIVVYRNGNASDPQKKTITIKKAVAGGGGESPSPETITFASLGLENSVQYSAPFNGGHFTITFAGGGNDGKYYNTGSGIRTYGGGTITIASDSTISEIEFTWDGSYCPGDDVADPSGYSSATKKWTGSAKSIVLTRPSGSGHWRLQSVTVTYE